MPNKNSATARIPECHPDRKHTAHGLCAQCYNANYGHKTRIRRNEVARKWAALNPIKRLAQKRRHLYGIEPGEVQARLNAQSGICPICMCATAAHLDHDHSNGLPRGLLCGNCNRALGLLKDNPAALERAAAYLTKWKAFNLMMQKLGVRTLLEL